MVTPVDMRNLARRAGCTFVETYNRFDGLDDGASYELTCPDMASKVRLLDLLATRDAQNPRVRALAADIIGYAPFVGPAAALHAAVQRRVRFVPEERETFQSALVTWALGTGDCDCQTALLAALCRASGITVRLVTLGSPATHVYSEVLLGGRWWPAETTIAAAIGEHPLAAKRRLGLHRRSDIG